MEAEESNGEKEVTTVPLSEVVSECVKRWFSDTLKEAKAGDVNMQVLVGQMYFNGYGVTRDAQKVRSTMAFTVFGAFFPKFFFSFFPLQLLISGLTLLFVVLIILMLEVVTQF